jgi:hypothetical protein
MSDSLANGHLDDSVLAAIVDGDVSHPDAIAHLSECEDCRRRMSAVAHLMDDVHVSGEIELLERPRRRWIPVVGTLAAAAVATIIIAGPSMMRSRPAPSESDTTIHREGTITTTAPPKILSPSSVARRGEALRWTSVAGADIYRVQVWNTEGNVVLSTETPDTTLAIPANLAQAGATYLWEVKARTGWDRWVSSEFLQFTIRE